MEQLNGSRQKIFDSLIKSRDIRDILRLTALLHDIDHLPFSHTSERLIQDYELYDLSLFPETSDRLLPHEESSFLIITEIYGEVLRDNLPHVIGVRKKFRVKNYNRLFHIITPNEISLNDLYLSTILSALDLFYRCMGIMVRVRVDVGDQSSGKQVFLYQKVILHPLLNLSHQTFFASKKYLA